NWYVSLPPLHIPSFIPFPSLKLPLIPTIKHQTNFFPPPEHGGLKEDGTQDKRVGTGEFAQGQVDPHEAGKAGGKTSGSGGSSGGSSASSGGGDYKPTEHDGLTKDGKPDGRVKQ
ncbi:hypothetical protein LOCC1_G006982, partial [Lachnellula occidentalis]